MITKLEQLLPLAQAKNISKLSVACPYDIHTIQAIDKAQKMNIVKAKLFGNKEKISLTLLKLNLEINDFEIIDINNDNDALFEAVKLVSIGDADILMKGLISSEKYLKAVLARHNGLLGNTAQITHITVLENSRLNKLISFGDSAIIPNPDFKQKLFIINALASMSRILGCNNPKVAIIAATEIVSQAITAGNDAAIISKMSDRGQLDFIADGPLSIDISIDKEAAEIKSINGPIKGDADCLLFPDIESGNAFYKANTKLAGSNIAGCLAGTKAPVVMTSRADSSISKFYSILLAKVAGTII
ncbi:MAG: phosphate butyryltransferase [Bacteroidales bacterium]|nr:phosphate butyryltransferase [Bacteroidales bacterium]